MADELAAKLARQRMSADGQAVPKKAEPFNPYTAFPEFTRKQIKEYQNMFKTYDTGKDGFICLMELKLMMEKLGHAQTHAALKQMIATVDEDQDDQMSFKEFLMIFKLAAAGELELQGLKEIALASSVDVSKEGVGGAKNFFEAKDQAAKRGSEFEAEIKAEQEERKKEAEAAAARKAEFKRKMASFH
mmetsp:Transcript_56853/g.78820  ORF Transcript_56853/g.78820 Transcript_56853/m.78820 type:complete len:188 (-) Transcript_56853:149-712(-)